VNRCKVKWNIIEDMSDESGLRLAEAHATAQAVLRGETSILEAARLLASKLMFTDLHHTEIHLFFIGISSESDDLPLGVVREYWSPESLKRKDQEIAAYESKIHENFMSTCRRVIDLTGLHGADSK
jgi:hypothetical protein